MMTSTRSLCARWSVLARVACLAMRRCSHAPSSIFRTLVESRAAPERCRNQATGQNSKLAIRGCEYGLRARVSITFPRQRRRHSPATQPRCYGANENQPTWTLLASWKWRPGFWK
jgi:hypothetical protein